MKNLTIICGSDDAINFTKNHFGDSEKFIFYKYNTTEKKLILDKIIDNKTPEEEGHGDPEKAKKIKATLKEADALCAFTMGSNIERIRKNFVPLLSQELNIKNALKKLELKIDEVLEETKKEPGEKRKVIYIEENNKPETKGKIIGITGGKGGTGKSTIATALARELSKNNKVLLLDMDASCPDDHILLNLKRKQSKIATSRIPVWNNDLCTKCGLCSKVCLSQAVVNLPEKYPMFIEENCNGCGACVHKCPTGAISWGEKEIGFIYKASQDNLDLISCETKVGELLGEDVIAQAKEYAWQEIGKKDYDYILIDTAAGTHCEVIEALDGADFTLVVAEPTPLGAHDMVLILKLLDKIKIEAKIVLNRSGMGDDSLIENQTAGNEIIAKIPFNEELMKAYARAENFDLPGIEKLINKI